MAMPSLIRAAALATHPLEVVEEVMIERDLNYDRPVEEEILAEISGQWNTLKLWYRWEESLSVLVMTCGMEGKTPPRQREKIYPLLASINEKLWLGHFDISAEDGAVMFRHSLLLQPGEEPAQEQLNALLDIAVTECNRAYPALQAVLWGGKSPEEALNAALFETCGEA